jgi:hypothetical protein
MGMKELEQRVTALEQKVKELAGEIARTSNRILLAAIQQYKGDEDVLAVRAEAMKLRERERRAVRKWAKSRKP